MLRHQLQGANISHSMQNRLLFKIDFVCKVPPRGSRVIPRLHSIIFTLVADFILTFRFVSGPLSAELIS